MLGLTVVDLQDRLLYREATLSTHESTAPPRKTRASAVSCGRGLFAELTSSFCFQTSTHLKTLAVYLQYIEGFTVKVSTLETLKILHSSRAYEQIFV